MATRVDGLKVLHSFGPYHSAVGAIAARQGTSEIFGAIDDSIYIIDVKTKEIVEKISRAHAAPISSLSVCGEILVTTCCDGTLCLRSIKERPSVVIAKIMLKPNGGKGSAPDLLSCRIIVDDMGQTLIGASAGNEVYCIYLERLFDYMDKLKSSKKKWTPEGNIQLHSDFAKVHRLHSDRVSCVNFTENGEFMLSAAEDGTVILIRRDDLLPFSKAISSEDDNYDDETDNHLTFGCLSLPEGVRNMALYGEDSHLLLVATDSEQLSGYKWSISSEGDIVFTETMKMSPELRNEETLRQDNISFNCISSILTKPPTIMTSTKLAALASSADGSRFLIKEFDETGQSSKFTYGGGPKRHTDTIRCACFSMSGVLVTGGDDGMVCVWSTHTDSLSTSDKMSRNGRCRRPMHKNTKPIRSSSSPY